jgi:multidrug efflux pump
VAGARVFLVPVQDIRIGARQSDSQYQYTLQVRRRGPLRMWEPKIRLALSNLRSWKTSAPTSRTTACRPR